MLDPRTAKMCAAPTDTVRRVMEIMVANQKEFALVVQDGGKLIGTISDGDLRRGLLAGRTLESRAAEIMNPKFTAVGPETGRAEALDLMKALEFRHLPVVDEDGILVGIHLLKELIGAIERPNWAVLMVGGRGTRLAPLTDSIPKPMLSVAGRPILERLVLHLIGFGVRRIYMAVHYLAHMIVDHFKDGHHLGCQIQYLRETRPLGTCGALSLLEDVPEQPILVMNGDLVTEADIGQLLEHHTRSNNTLTVGTKEHTYAVPFGVVTAEDARITGIHEKPSASWLVSAGIYVVEPALLPLIPRDTEYSFPTLIESRIRAGDQVGAYFIEDPWIDVGRRHELDRARGAR